MRVMICSARRLRKAAILIAVAALGVCLLWYPEAAATGVKRGLGICAQLLIPSLFPFMVLSGFVIRSGMAQSIGRYASGITKTLFGWSGCAAVAVTVSLIGGYPAGGAAVAQLYDNGNIDKAQARHLLCCCVNAGPAFVIGGIGVGMLGSAKAGLLLLTAHWLALLIVMLGRRCTFPAVAAPTSSRSVWTAVSDSVNSTCASLIAMCGFVLAACTAVSLIDAMGGAAFAHSPIRTWFSCMLEVSTGCMEAASSGRMTPFIIGAALGFGGLSVHGQIAAVTAGRDLLTKAFFTTRLMHGLLGGCLSLILFRLIDPQLGVVTASTVLSSVTRSNDGVAAVGLLSLMMLCALFLITVKNSLLRTRRL